MTANSFCVFFLLKLTRAVRWGKNSGTRTRMILREMEVSVGTQTNCRSSLLYLFIYTFSGFSLSASRHVTSFSHSILLSSILVNRTYGSRPETRGISLHRTFFFLAFRQEPLWLLVPCLHIRIDTICRECSWFKILVTAQNKTQEQLNKTKQQRINQGWSYHCL